MPTYKSPLEQSQALQDPFKYWDDDTLLNYAKNIEYGGLKGQDAADLIVDDLNYAVGEKRHRNINSMQDLVNSIKKIKDVKEYYLKGGPGQYAQELEKTRPSRNFANLDDSYIGTILRDFGYEF